jgi:hypothetical protein
MPQADPSNPVRTTTGRQPDGTPIMQETGVIGFAMGEAPGGFFEANSMAETAAGRAEMRAHAKNINEQSYRDVAAFRDALTENGYVALGDTQGFVGPDGRWRPIDTQSYRNAVNPDPDSGYPPMSPDEIRVENEKQFGEYMDTMRDEHRRAMTNDYDPLDEIDVEPEPPTVRQPAAADADVEPPTVRRPPADTGSRAADWDDEPTVEIMVPKELRAPAATTQPTTLFDPDSVVVNGHDAPVPGPNTLTVAELAELQDIADRFDTELHVVGSRGAGNGRGVESDFPVGKGDNTKSDIDVVIDGDVDITSRGGLSDRVSGACGGVANVASSIGFASGAHITIKPRRR